MFEGAEEASAEAYFEYFLLATAQSH